MKCPNCGFVVIETEEMRIRRKWKEAQTLVRRKYGKGFFTKYAGWDKSQC